MEITMKIKEIYFEFQKHFPLYFLNHFFFPMGTILTGEIFNKNWKALTDPGAKISGFYVAQKLF